MGQKINRHFQNYNTSVSDVETKIFPFLILQSTREGLIDISEIADEVFGPSQKQSSNLEAVLLFLSSCSTSHCGASSLEIRAEQLRKISQNLCQNFPCGSKVFIGWVEMITWN